MRPPLLMQASPLTGRNRIHGPIGPEDGGARIVTYVPSVTTGPPSNDSSVRGLGTGAMGGIASGACPMKVARNL